MIEPSRPDDAGPYADAVKALQTDALSELRHLASKMPNQLLVSCQSIPSKTCRDNNGELQEVYDHLEVKVNEIISSGVVDEHRKTLYQAFLFTIMYVTSRFPYSLAHSLGEFQVWARPKTRC